MEYNFSDRLKNLGGNAIREIFKLLSQPGMISFAGGFPTLSTLPKDIIREIHNEILSSDDAFKLLQYGGTEGYIPFIDTAIDYVKRYGIKNITREEVLIVSGGQQTIDLTMKAFINKGDVILVENPTYLAVLHIAHTYEATTIGLKSSDDGIDLWDLKEKIKLYNPKLLYLVPTFSNPTGRTISLEKRKEIFNITKENNIIILEDDPYSEIRFEGERVTSIKSLDDYGNVIYTTSFSKTIAPTLRTAIAVANKEVIRKLTIGKQATDVHTSNISQAIINEYLKRGLMDNRLPELISIYKEKKDAMIKAIEKYMPNELKYTNPKGGLFIWCELPKHINTDEIFKDVVEKTSVAYVGGSAFFADGNTKNCFRLNYSNSTLEQINAGIKKLGDYFKSILA